MKIDPAELPDFQRQLKCGAAPRFFGEIEVRERLRMPDLIDAMEADSGEPISELRVDGGAAVNNFLMQFQADILGVPVSAPISAIVRALPFISVGPV